MSQPDFTILKKRVAKAPTGPGVYRWLDKDGNVLYVGKAKNLKNRLKSYVLKGAWKGLGLWKQSLLMQIADVDLTVTNSEIEALVLETNLIKQFRPKYNIVMKDDKNYVYIKIDLKETYPRVDVVRQVEEDGAKYFGPRPSADTAYRTLSFLRTVYPFRTCKMEIEIEEAKNKIQETEKLQATSYKPQDHTIPLDVTCKYRDRPTPCLDHHIGQCSAPCIGLKTPAQYREESIDGVIEFLKGNEKPMIDRLKQKMEEAAKEKKYELAASMRDHLRSLLLRQDKQIVSDPNLEDADIIGIALLSGRSNVVVMQQRGGKVIDETSFSLAGSADSLQEVLNQFLPQFYSDSRDIPGVILIGEDFDERATTEEWLATQRGKKVKLLVPERGKKSHLLQLAEKNAHEKALQQEVRWEAESRNIDTALQTLAEKLHLKGPPARIEGYDISHTGGTETVGSMVVFKDGKPANDHYRSFTLRTIKSGMIDDYRSLREVLMRRLRYVAEDLKKEEEKWKAGGFTFGKLKKGEMPLLESLLPAHWTVLQDLEDAKRDAFDYLVARKDGEAVAIAYVRQHSPSAVELFPPSASDDPQVQGLQAFLIRKMLRGFKSGKVYVCINASLEQPYAELGFRYIKASPAFLEHRMKDCIDPEFSQDGDILMMYEVSQNKTDPSFASTPDLLVIDGGKGQLSTVVEVLKDMKLDIPVIGLAKREEEVFLPGESESTFFEKDSPAKFMLMRLRDEAHRFANRHRQKRKAKAEIASSMDVIPGIGPRAKNQLLRQFGTIDGVKNASDGALRLLLRDDQIEALRRYFKENE